MPNQEVRTGREAENGHCRRGGRKTILKKKFESRLCSAAGSGDPLKPE